MSIPSEQVLLNAINHPIRRELLAMIATHERSYTELLDHFDISTGKLNYHLKLLEGMIAKSATNWYHLTELGSKTLDVLQQIRDHLILQDPSLIKQAYLSQQASRPTFLHMMFVTRMKFKFWLLILIAIVLITTAIIYIAVGGHPEPMIPILIAGGIILIGGFVWVIHIQKNAPEFVERVDKLLNRLDE